MIFMTRSSMSLASLGRLSEQGHGAGAAPRDAAWRDLSSLRDEVPEPADVLVVDQVDPVDAELANLAAPEPAPLDGLRCWRNGSSLLYRLERDLVVAALAAGFHRFGDGGRGRRLGSSHALHPLGHDLDDAPFLAVLRLPVARLQPALDHDGAAFVEVLAA